MKKEKKETQKGAPVQVVPTLEIEAMIEQFQALRKAQGKPYISKPKAILFILDKYGPQFMAWMEKEAKDLVDGFANGKK